MRIRNVIVSFLTASTMLLAETAQERLKETAAVFSEIMATPDKGIPEELVGKARCIVIIPGMKSGAFVVGGKFGRGYAMCRKSSGVGWGAPAAVRAEGGSFGFQIGGQSTDVVLLMMNERGMQHLLKSKFTLGADASIAAGPVGRETSADTDASMHAEILSWSRSRGVFAGVSLQGATLRNDDEGNHELYGKDVTSKEILSSDMTPPAEAQDLIAALDRHSRVQGRDSADRVKPKE
ncbi:MAG TPA: lipid-binding SYLF domain-containing protein [Bryobacteraceae bacterium]|nr:lipid-binding SYLF domain-containing protein [Bryobacteraceae bacterium]